MSELLDLEEENTPTPCLTNPQNLNWIFSERAQAFFRKVLNTVGLAENETMESRRQERYFLTPRKLKKVSMLLLNF